ncbi:type ISP restriction/modification enzyme [Micromonospora sp. URMC 103]|uniref:type ISP restriction/modification enzyme n=1 Tax=Micromonospora sp. URMC 103 TaxID=3423406 RepID=UPI003F1D3357
MTSFSDLIAAFGASAAAKLSGPGQREALLIGPVATFIENVGTAAGLNVTAHNEVTELDGTVRPDFGVRVNGLLTGYIELKAPGTSLDPSSYGSTTHNYRQWQRLKELPNLLHTNGIEWRLWRYGELVDQPVHLHAKDLSKPGRRLTAPPRFELLVNSFLQWQPAPIMSVARLVTILAPLARMLREEVQLALKAERRATKAGAPLEEQPFLGIARDWRAMLFPNATDAEFADGYAQTVTFALLLAVSDGIDVAKQSLYDVSQRLEARHSLMARALNLLTEHVRNSPTWLGVEMITRVLAAVDWPRVAAGGSDVYLHLYEHFLSEYDPVKRKKSGSYYTPVEIVDAMVGLSDQALRKHLGQPQGLRSANVAIVDPAMGTGTYPLSVLRHVATEASAQYGPGAAPEAVANAVERLYGMELQSGAFSVAELRVTSAISDSGAEFPAKGLNLYVADTLEDPASASSAQLSYTLQLVAKQRQLANKMKRERNIHVCIGNPPYKDHAGGMGGWIESGIDPRTGEAPLDAFRLQGNGLHERHLSNLYVYFWRWAFWKTFESTDYPDVKDGDKGLVCFITATGYLAGPGFKGLRRYIREKCSHGWIINLTPEGKQPPAKSAVFNIETPVAIGLFLRSGDSNPVTPAGIKYVALTGTREEKFAQLASLTLEDSRWQTVRSGWTDPFTPSADSEWDTYPAMDQLYPWKAAGIMAGHAWVYGPTRDIVEERLRYLVQEGDPIKKSRMFGEGRDSSLSKTKKPLAGSDTERDTGKPFGGLVVLPNPKVVRVGYRAFDRQWIAADSRLLIQPSPDLWWGRLPPGQVFTVELHSEHPKAGPGLAFSALIPDAHFFRGSGGGRALPMFHPDGTPNLSPGLLAALEDNLGAGVASEDLTYYIAGVVSHGGFVARFDKELQTPGVRVPITKIRALWDRAVALGRLVVWLHTFGTRGAHPSGADDVRSVVADGLVHPSYITPVRQMPERINYDPNTQILGVGTGKWGPVIPEVRAYTVGGSNIIDSWVGYRLAKPKGRRNSPLDDVNVASWPGEWSIEFSELLSALTQLVALEPEQEQLLSTILSGPVFSIAELSSAGAVFPSGAADRKPRKPTSAGEVLF